MTHASARIRQSSCHSRLLSAAGLPRHPTTHTMAWLSSGSPHVTSQAGLEAQVTSPVLATATTWPVPAYLPQGGQAHTGPKVLVHLPAVGSPGQLRRPSVGPALRSPGQNRTRRLAQGSRIPGPGDAFRPVAGCLRACLLANWWPYGRHEVLAAKEMK